MRNYIYSAVNVFSKVANTSLLFLIIVNVAEKELFGLFSYYQSLTLILLVLVDYGFNLYLAKEFTLDVQKNEQLFNQVILLKVFISLILLIFTFIGVFIDIIYNPSLLVLILLIGVINSFISTYGVLIRNYQKFKLEAMISFSITLVSIGSLFILSKSFSNLIVLLIPIITFKLLHLLLMIWFLKYLMGFNYVDMKVFNFNNAKLLIRNNFSYAVHLTIGTLYFQIDTLILKHLDSLDAVAEYTAAFKLIALILVGTEVVNNVLIPKISNIRMSGSSEYITFLNKSNKIMNYVSLIIILIFTVFAFGIKDVIFSTEFEDTNQLLVILSAMVYFRYISIVPGIIITIENMQKYRTNIALIGLLVNTIFATILIPILSYYGAAISSLLSAASIWIAYKIVLKRKGF